MDAELDGLPLVGHAEFQRDSERRELPTQLDPGAWSPFTAQDRFQGNSSDNFWLRFSLRNPGKEQRHWVIAHDQTWIDSMTAFTDTSDQWRDSAGASLPFVTRTLLSTRPAIIHEIGPGETVRVFIRLSNASGADMRILLRLYEARRFVSAMQSYANLQSLYFGICVALAAVWAVFAVILRQSTFVSYAVYVLFTGLAWLSLRGLWFQYATPELPSWSHAFNVIGIAAAAGCAFDFTRRALRLNSVAPALDRCAKALVWISGAASMLCALHILTIGQSYMLARTLHALTLANAYFAWVSWRRGTPQTGWLVVGWSIYGVALLATLMLTLIARSHAAFDAISPQTINQVASLIEMLCFTISLAQWVRTQQQERLAAEHSANTDGLTGLNNRKCVERRLGELMALPAAPGMRWLGVVDIDFFKKVNDTYGHAAGDAVLRAFANVLRANSRQADTFGRFGGEEFVLVLDGIDREGAERITNRLREAFEAAPTVFEGKAIPHTLSLGLAAHICETELQPWFERADAALYEAKHGGRNRVCVAT